MQTAITRTSGPGRVLLVDDHPAVRRVLRSLLEEVGGWQVVGEADSGESAVELVEQLAPNVVLMDCRMPGAGGVGRDQGDREALARGVGGRPHRVCRRDLHARDGRRRGPRLRAQGRRARGRARGAVGGQAGPGPAVGGGHRPGHGGPARAVRGRGQPLQGAGGRERRPQLDGGPARGGRPPQGRVPGHGQPRAADPDHGRPRHGSDPGRAARHGGDGRRPGDPPAGRSAGQAAARHGRAAPPGERVRGQPQPGPAGRGGPGRRRDRRGGRRLAAGRARPAGRAAPPRGAPVAAGRRRGAADGGRQPGRQRRQARPARHPVQVEVTQPRGLTRIEVTDRGEGVAEIDRERIFAPFTQLDASTTRRVGGVGLGLFLVDRLVRGMGGKVWFEDNPGGGARFVVELPDLARYRVAPRAGNLPAAGGVQEACSTENAHDC